MDLSQFSTDALVSSVFRDSYTLDAEKLESLYSKSKRHQWNAESDVDWSRFDPAADVLDRETEFLFRLDCVNALPSEQQTSLWKAANIFLLSQVLHGQRRLGPQFRGAEAQNRAQQET